MHAPTFAPRRPFGLASDAGRPRAIRHGLILGSTILSIGIMFGIRDRWGTFGWDSFAYWSVDPRVPYTTWAEPLGAFRYSPAAAQVASLFHVLPWEVFRWGWMAVLAVIAARVAGWWVLLVPAVVLELFVGNVHVLLAAAIVVGFRYPVAWSVVLLTKVTPGVGLLWFAVRREWRPLAIAVGATTLIAAVSFAAAPSLWSDWVSHLMSDTWSGSSGVAIPLFVRLPLAAALVMWGARTDRRWTVPTAAMLSLPVLWPMIGPAMLIAAVPLLGTRVATSSR